MKSTCSNQRGLSLVELLVALAISLVLLAGVYQIFVGSTTTYSENEEFSRLQENARFAMELIGRDLRVSGYTGCARIPGSVVNTLADTSFLYDFNVGVQGFDYTGPTTPSGLDSLDFTPNLDSSIPLTGLNEGSDVLTLRRPDLIDPVLLDADMGSSSSSIDLPNGTGTDFIDTDDIVMVSDCEGASIFQVTGYTSSTGIVLHATGSGSPGNSTTDLNRVFEEGSEVVKMRTVSYFVRDNVAGVPSLYRTDVVDGTTELVQGVERMQVRYGIDTDGDEQVDSYETAAVASGDWDEVVAVRIGLLFRSDIIGKLPADTATYDLDGDGTNEYDPADERRIRRVFKATFALRNRL